MSGVFRTVLSLSVSGSAVLLLLLALRPLLRGRLGRRAQCALWLIVAARLLLPFAPPADWLRAVPQPRPPASAQAPAPPEEPDAREEARETPARRAGPDAARLWQAAWMVWLGGALALAIRRVTLYQSFARYVRAGWTRVEDPALLDRFAELCGDAGVRRPVELCVNPLLASPVSMGVLRPCVVLRSASLSGEDFANTALHEALHHRRHDLAFKWLMQLALCVHWFNPLVHWMASLAGRDCELACDEAVLSLLGETRRRSYGDTLLRSLKTAGAYRDAAACVALTESGKQLRERLDAIMKFHSRTKSAAFGAAALTCALCLAATVAGAYRVPAPPAAQAGIQPVNEAWGNRLATATVNGRPVDITTEHAETVPFDSFESIDAQIGPADVRLVPSDRYELEYHYFGEVRRLDYSVSAGTLVLEDRLLIENVAYYNGSVPTNLVTVRYPANALLTSVSVDNAFGDFACDGLRSGSVRIQADNGNVTLKGVTASSLTVQGQFGDAALRDVTVDSLDVASANGDLGMERVTASTAKIDGRFGDVSARESSFGGLDIDAGNGAVDLSAKLAGKTGIVAAFGSLTLRVEGERRGYGLDLSADFGSIELDGRSVEPVDEWGMSVRHKENMGAANTIRVECGNGDADIRFGAK